MGAPKGPKVLLFDIETAPMLGYVWSLWENNVALNQLHSDWYILSFAAKWADLDEVIYHDQRHEEKIEDDSKLLKKLWYLLDAADVVVTQNGKAFDQKKVFARFILQGFQPPSSFKHIDTKQIAQRTFGFSSNKLEYLTAKLCKRFRKSKHKRYPGFELWLGCLAGKATAWQEMEKYNKADVLALEELWEKLRPWNNGGVNLNLFHDEAEYVCPCGSKLLKRQGFAYTAAGKYQRYRCKVCGAESRDRKNLFGKDKIANLHVDIKR